MMTTTAPADGLAARERPLTDDERAMVAENVGLVGAHLNRRFGPSHPLNDDLYQEGVTGLMTAAQRFDPTRGVKFSTYGDWWIRSKVSDFFRKQSRLRLRSPNLDDDDDSFNEPADPFDPLGDLEDAEHAKALTMAALKPLNAREREILLRRADGQTLNEVATAFGISRERVRQIQARATSRARAALQPLVD